MPPKGDASARAIAAGVFGRALPGIARIESSADAPGLGLGESKSARAPAGAAAAPWRKRKAASDEDDEAEDGDEAEADESAPAPKRAAYTGTGKDAAPGLVRSGNAAATAVAEAEARASDAYADIVNNSSLTDPSEPVPVSIFKCAGDYVRAAAPSGRGAVAADAVGAIDVLAIRATRLVKIFTESAQGTTPIGKAFKAAFVAGHCMHMAVDQKAARPKGGAQTCVLGSPDRTIKRKVQMVSFTCASEHKGGLPVVTSFPIAVRPKQEISHLRALALALNIHVFIYQQQKLISSAANLKVDAKRMIYNKRLQELCDVYNLACAYVVTYFSEGPLGS